jgi:hypothetical protein
MFLGGSQFEEKQEGVCPTFTRITDIDCGAFSLDNATPCVFFVTNCAANVVEDFIFPSIGNFWELVNTTRLKDCAGTGTHH